MEKSTIINYVCEHVMFDEFSSDGTRIVRFPFPVSENVFTASSEESLVNKIWNYVQTNDGRKLIEGLDFSAYTDENYNPEEESE